MKSYVPLLFSISIALLSCATKKQVVSLNVGGGDGSSYEQAIIVNETHESPGTAAEYSWIKAHYPHYINDGQTLAFNEKKPFDIISIVMPSGKKVTIYFDISKFYGKF